MKIRLATSLIGLSAALLLAACGSSQYIIGTKTGNLIVTNGKPSLDEKSGTYIYEDAEGRKGTIGKDEVTQILQR